MKLLLVGPPADDSIRQRLQEWGHEVVHVPHAEQAEPWLRGVEGVLVSGREVAEEIARRPIPDVRPRPFFLALLPTSNEPVPLEALLAAAVDDYLITPIEPSRLRTRLEWLGRRRKAGMQATRRNPLPVGELERLTAIIETQNEVALAGLEMDTVMRLIAERSLQLSGAAGASVALVEGEELVYRVVVGTQAPHLGYRMKLANSLAGLSILRGEVLHTCDTENDPRVNVTAARQVNVRSMIVVPLQRGGTGMGVLNILYTEPNAYDDLALRTMELMGQLLGAALINASEFEAKGTLVSEFADTLAALQQSQELFHSFMNQSPLLAFMKDDTGRRTWVNEAYARFFHHTVESMVGVTDTELLPAVAEQLRQEEQLVLTTGQRICSEQVLHSPEGSEHHWLIHKFALRDAFGRHLLGGVAVDITARKNAEEALRRSEESFRTLIEGLPEAIFVHRGGRLLYINPAGLTFLGHGSAEGLDGTSLLELIHPDDREAAAGVLEGDFTSIREVRFLRAGEVPVAAELSAMRLLFDGEAATVVSARDVTERKQMQSRLLLADRLASVGTLAAGIAHEINNPLAFVLSNLGFLEQECQRLMEQLPAEALREMQEVLSETYQGAERMRHIMRDLRTLSRDDGEQLCAVDVREVLESSLRLVRNELRGRAQLMKDFEPVPVVWASEIRLGQVFLNLLINAAQALPPNQPERNEVRVRVRAIGTRVVIEVTDTGMGIAPEVRDRIFDPFFTTKPVGTGTGLGLSICHGIVSGLGGEITVESELGRGTTFRITLPAAPAAPQQLGNKSSSS